MVMIEVLKTISSICREDQPPPQVLHFLNYHPGNDFNTIFQSLPNYDEQLKKEDCIHPFVPCYVMGAPGSFYGRLFPDNSIHFVHSSYSLHWLSQVPQGLEDDRGNKVNRGQIYIANTSPPSVQKLYLEQFRKDFTTFLGLRSVEMVSGGQMVLTLLGRSSCQLGEELCKFYGLVAKALMTMASEGIVEEHKVDGFDLPLYAPSMEEISEIVRSEGSFELCEARVFRLNWDPSDDENMDDIVENCQLSGENVAKTLRAVHEPLFASQFGEAIMDTLFSRFGENVAKHLSKEKTKHANLTLVLRKRS